ncbi:hypothetical protein ACWC2K_20700 [Streptomyces chattanoogensis]
MPLTGAPPFRRDEVMALLWAHRYGSPPALAERRPDLPPHADPVPGRAPAKSPEHDTCRGSSRRCGRRAEERKGTRGRSTAGTGKRR